jgi:glycosyltransferase involved in cell wall biosynthesis
MLSTITNSEFQGKSTDVSRDLMLFELSWSGHHAGYILHLIQHWCKNNLSGSFKIVVSPEFVQKHTDVVNVALNCGQKNVHFIAITPEESHSLYPESSFRSRAARSFQALNLLSKYASQTGVEQCLITYLDSFQLSLAAGFKLPCTVSGIYFRPTFHYNCFAGHSSSFKERIQQWRERLLVSRVLSHPQFKTLFCLDPFVVSYLATIHRDAHAVHLPDPVQNYVISEEQLQNLRDRLGISPDRQVFLLFGRLEGRKGIYQLLQAVSALPPALCEKLCLLLVGPIDSNDRLSMASKITEISQTLPVQIITLEQFIPDHEIQSYFQISDVILAPYQRHVGMSAILVRAAAAQKPVLTSSYGLMGEVTRQHHLGLAIDSTNPEEIAKGLMQFLLNLPDQFCDHAKMQAFAEENSAERFANVIFQHL